MLPTEETKFNWFLWLIGICCFISIATSFYFFYFKKDYQFVVEVRCDTTKEICFQRDCSDPTNCPPNELSDFKRYTLSAKDFGMCTNEDCTNACENKLISCTPVKCTENLDAGESCSSPDDIKNN